jgi:hypothetical protein
VQVPFTQSAVMTTGGQAVPLWGQVAQLAMLKPASACWRLAAEVT